MSCNSGIYAVNTVSTTVNAGSIVPVNTIVRRYGNALNIGNYGVVVRAQGYYEVHTNITLAPTAAGLITVSLYKDGVAVTGASTTVTGTAGDYINVSLDALVKQTCCADPAALTIVLSAEATTSNVGMVVTKV